MSEEEKRLKNKEKAEENKKLKNLIEEKFDRIKIFRESRLITEWFINVLVPLALFAMFAMIHPLPFTFIPTVLF